MNVANKRASEGWAIKVNLHHAQTCPYIATSMHTYTHVPITHKQTPHAQHIHIDMSEQT